jgi:hypothetical protein
LLGAEDDGGAAVVRDGGFDEFDGSAGADDAHLGVDGVDRSVPEDVERQSGRHEVGAAAGVPVLLVSG